MSNPSVHCDGKPNGHFNFVLLDADKTVAENDCKDGREKTKGGRPRATVRDASGQPATTRHGSKLMCANLSYSRLRFKLTDTTVSTAAVSFHITDFIEGA